MANFLGFKQVSLTTYQNTLKNNPDELLNRMWLVREFSGETVVSSAIYFGTRLYAETNKPDEGETAKINAIISALGNAVDENGEWNGFLPSDILGDSTVSSITEALTVLEQAILENKESIEKNSDAINALEGTVSSITSSITNNYYTKEEIDNAFDQAYDELADDVKKNTENIETLDDKVSAITSSLTNNYYTKDVIDGKIAGVWHFKGTKDSLEALENEAKAEGDVWQIGEKEYAWNGTEWVELGFNIDLTDYATKEEVEKKVSNLATVVSSAVTEIHDEIDELRDVATITVDKYTDAVSAATSDNIGKIIYVNNDETIVTPTGDTTGTTVYSAGAYIVTGPNTVSKLGTTSASGDIAGDVENLKGDVSTLKEDVEELKEDKHREITGDDVEDNA